MFLNVSKSFINLCNWLCLKSSTELLLFYGVFVFVWVRCCDFFGVCGFPRFLLLWLLLLWYGSCSCLQRFWVLYFFRGFSVIFSMATLFMAPVYWLSLALLHFLCYCDVVDPFLTLSCGSAILQWKNSRTKFICL